MENLIGITGASGFIGNRLVIFLKKLNIKYVKFEGDLLNTDDVNSFFKKNKISTVIHLAGQFDNSFDNLIASNSLTTFNILNIGNQYELKKIIYISSAAVYGNGKKDKLSKETDNLVPNTHYGLSKMLAEEIILFHYYNFRIKFTILRLSSTYGPNNNKGVIFNFLNQIKTEGRIVVYGDGNQERSFLYVDDAVRAILLSIRRDKNNIFNISSPSTFTVNQIVNILQNKYNLKFKVHNLKSNNQLTKMDLDTTKAKKLLHFEPVHNDLYLNELIQ